MIEPFEFETIRLAAPRVQHEQKDVPVKGNGTVDEDLQQGISSFNDPLSQIKMDVSRQKVFQTRFGNPSLESRFEAHFQNDRVVGLGPLVVGGEEPSESKESTVSSSELFHRFLDVEASFVPSISNHVFPSMKTIGLDQPNLSPGLTTINSRKVNVHWSNK